MYFILLLQIQILGLFSTLPASVGDFLNNTMADTGAGAVFLSMSYLKGILAASGVLDVVFMLWTFFFY